MNEDNELLLKQFFSEASQQQIADDGFSQRVMQRLPSRINWFTRLWNIACILIFAILFVWFDGMQQLAVQLFVWVRTLAAEPFSINLMMVFSVISGLLFVGVGEVIYSESTRKSF